MEEKIYLNDEYQRIMKMIFDGKNICLFRYGDGERNIMCGIQTIAQEGWKAPNYVTELGKGLLRTLDLEDENVFYGISCPCCDRNSYYWYSTRIKSKNITFANMFVNANYKYFVDDFKKIRRNAVVICNEEGKGKQIGNLNVLDYYCVDNDCVSFYEKKLPSFIEEIKNKYGKSETLLFVVSAGPLSEPIIYDLYKNNKNNCYIDFGSCIDIYIHNRDTRPYCNEKTEYAKRNCWMFNPNSISFNVSVVLTLFKRPEALKTQLDAVLNQSLKPKEVILFQDKAPIDVSVEEELLDRFDDVKIAKENVGVWGRFDFARTAKSRYVCLFDDDTIPGSRWLENCHYQSQLNKGVYGTNGVVIKNYDGYPIDLHSFINVGWKYPNSEIKEVDFVGHSWFLETKWLEYMFDNTEKYQKFKIAAEDMCVSVCCNKNGIKTFVPPHPELNFALWGSLPEYGVSLGNNSASLYVNGNNENMNNAIKMLQDEGWKPLYIRNNAYVEKLESDYNKYFRTLRFKKIYRKLIKLLRRFKKIFK